MLESAHAAPAQPRIEALTFDLFGTVLDLGGSSPLPAAFLRENPPPPRRRLGLMAVTASRIEQYQDNIVAMGHSGYLPSPDGLWSTSSSNQTSKRAGKSIARCNPGNSSTPSPTSSPP